MLRLVLLILFRVPFEAGLRHYGRLARNRRNSHTFVWPKDRLSRDLYHVGIEHGPHAVARRSVRRAASTASRTSFRMRLDPLRSRQRSREARLCDKRPAEQPLANPGGPQGLEGGCPAERIAPSTAAGSTQRRNLTTSAPGGRSASAQLRASSMHRISLDTRAFRYNASFRAT